MSNMYELSQQWQAVLDMANNPDIDEETIRDTLELIEGSVENKADNYAVVIRTLTGNSKACAEEIKRLQARKKSLETNVTRLKSVLFNTMIETGKMKFKTALNSFGTRKSERIDIDDDTKIDKQYHKVAITFDKAAIKQAIKAGEMVEGATLVKVENLSIR